MHSIEHHRHLNAGILLSIAGGYAFLNLAAVLLAARGIIHPPWSIFMFFAWLGPVVLILGISFFQIATRRRFSWPAARAFLLAAGIALLINLHIYGLALASV